MTPDQLLLVAGRHPLAHAVSAGLRAARVPEGAAVVLAASGGADSMALLAVGAALHARGRLRAVAVHVDHGLRPESHAEGTLVERAAHALGVPMVRCTLQLTRGANLAARARRARYQALARAAAEAGSQWIATAHHADDQLETMLLAMARGTGLRGLGGMRVRRRLPAPSAHGPVWVVRPLLHVPRADLRAACAAWGLAWAEDPTNTNLASPRARVRAQVTPVLDALAPGAATRAARTAAMAQWGAAELRRQAAELAVHAQEDRGWNRSVLRAAPLPVLAEFVRRHAQVAPRRVPGALAWEVALAIKQPGGKARTWHVAPGVQLRLGARTYGCGGGGCRQRS